MINIFEALVYSALYPIHDSLAPHLVKCTQCAALMRIDPSLTQTVSNDAEYWLMLLYHVAWINRTQGRSNLVNTFFTPVSILWSDRLKQHLMSTYCWVYMESIEQRVNVRGVVFSQIKTFALWWQTDLFQALLKHSTDRPAVRWVCSVSAWTSAASKTARILRASNWAIQTTTMAGV